MVCCIFCVKRIRYCLEMLRAFRGKVEWFGYATKTENKSALKEGSMYAGGC